MAATMLNFCKQGFNKCLILNTVRINSAITSRRISTTAPRLVMKVKETQEENKITLEGVIEESDRITHLVDPGTPGGKACPLCTLNLKLEHTDVLILSQFLRGDGTLLHQDITGLCLKQHKRVKRLVSEAQRAGLLPYTRAYWLHDEDHRPYDNYELHNGRKLNRYFRNTIKQTEHFRKHQPADKYFEFR